MCQAGHVLRQRSMLMITVKATLTTYYRKLPLGVRRAGEQRTGNYENLHGAETTTVKRFNSRNAVTAESLNLHM